MKNLRFDNFCEIFGPHLYYFGHEPIHNDLSGKCDILIAFSEVLKKIFIFMEKIY